MQVFKPFFSTLLFDNVRNVVDEQFIVQNNYNLAINSYSRIINDIPEIYDTQYAMNSWLGELTNNSLTPVHNNATLCLNNYSIPIHTSDQYDYCVMVTLFNHNHNWPFAVSELLSVYQVQYIYTTFNFNSSIDKGKIKSTLKWDYYSLNPNNAVLFNARNQFIFTDNMPGQCAVLLFMYFNIS